MSTITAHTSVSPVPVEDRKLVSPAELRNLVRTLRDLAEKNDLRTAATNDPKGQHRASAFRLAADLAGDILSSAIAAAEANDERIRDEQEAREAKAKAEANQGEETMTTSTPAKRQHLTFHKNAVTYSSRGTRVYYALSYLGGVNQWDATGSYNIEKLSPTLWVTTFTEGFPRKGEFAKVRRIGSFSTLTAAKDAARNDYADQQNQEEKS